MSTELQDFTLSEEAVIIGQRAVDASQIAMAVVEANQYLVNLNALLAEVRLDVFKALGIRNVSGFVGGVFSAFCASHLGPSWLKNPHPDGRPDILNLETADANSHFRDACFETISGERWPTKRMLAPFKFGGVEVKCTLGNIVNGSTFPVGVPRGEHITGLTFWGHHGHCTDMFGLYYDYYPPADHQPQILAVFFASFTSEDWHTVSLGDPTKKKTSNTSLRKAGVQKILDGCVVATKDRVYRDALSRVGVTLC